MKTFNFVTIRKGQFVSALSDGPPYNSKRIFGRIVDVLYKEVNGREFIRIHLIGGEEFTVLSIPTDSRSAFALYKLLTSIDITLNLSFHVKSINGKDVFYAIQNDRSVEWDSNSPFKKCKTCSSIDLRSARMYVEYTFRPKVRSHYGMLSNNSLFRPFWAVSTFAVHN